MAAFSGPEIPNGGLVFDYDMSNTKKSWMGAPTTNLVATVPYAPNVYTAVSWPVDATASDATYQMRPVNRYTITSTGGTPRARIIATGLITGVNYSYSCKIKYNGPTSSPSWYIDSSKGNPEPTNNTFNSHTTNSVYLGNGWYQLTENFNFATCPTGGAWANFGLYAPDATYLNQTFDAYDIQFEQTTYATPYVNGIRSSTQAILDLTGGNTITATSLTYASDNTFSFNGTSNYIPITYSPLNYTLLTINVWTKPTNTTQVATLVSEWGRSTGSNFKWLLFFNFWAQGNLYFVVGNAAGTGYSSHSIAHNLSTSSYINYTITYNVGTINMYQNGALVLNTSSANTTLKSITTPLTIGCDYDTGTGDNPYRFYNGQIPLVQIYNRALSATEVSLNFVARRDRYGI